MVHHKFLEKHSCSTLQYRTWGISAAQANHQVIVCIYGFIGFPAQSGHGLAIKMLQVYVHMVEPTQWWTLLCIVVQRFQWKPSVNTMREKVWNSLQSWFVSHCLSLTNCLSRSLTALSRAANCLSFSCKALSHSLSTRSRLFSSTAKPSRYLHIQYPPIKWLAHWVFVEGLTLQCASCPPLFSP